MVMDVRRQWIGLSLAVGVLCGCAASSAIRPVPNGETLSIVVVRSPQPNASAGIINQTLGDETRTGAGVGFVTGALFGVTCGPLVVVCVPLFGLTGFATGTVAGVLVGVSGSTLSEDKSELVLARLDRVQRSRNWVDDVAREVTELARLEWNLQSGAPTRLATIELKDIRVASIRDERIGLVVRATVRVRPASTDSSAATKEGQFEHLGPFTSLVDWLDESSDVIDKNLSIASRQLALQIVAALTPH